MVAMFFGTIVHQLRWPVAFRQLASRIKVDLLTSLRYRPRQLYFDAMSSCWLGWPPRAGGKGLRPLLAGPIGRLSRWAVVRATPRPNLCSVQVAVCCMHCTSYGIDGQVGPCANDSAAWAALHGPPAGVRRQLSLGPMPDLARLSKRIQAPPGSTLPGTRRQRYRNVMCVPSLVPAPDASISGRLCSKPAKPLVSWLQAHWSELLEGCAGDPSSYCSRRASTASLNGFRPAAAPPGVPRPATGAGAHGCRCGCHF